jgi:hypothetical protein|nr:MAG TPA: hypothetical protein [Caudoviricetes sp.]
MNIICAMISTLIIYGYVDLIKEVALIRYGR